MVPARIVMHLRPRARLRSISAEQRRYEKRREPEHEGKYRDRGRRRQPCVEAPLESNQKRNRGDEADDPEEGPAPQPSQKRRACDEADVMQDVGQDAYESSPCRRNAAPSTTRDRWGVSSL